MLWLQRGVHSLFDETGCFNIMAEGHAKCGAAVKTFNLPLTDDLGEMGRQSVMLLDIEHMRLQPPLILKFPVNCQIMIALSILYQSSNCILVLQI